MGLAAEDTPDEEVIQWVLIDSVQWRWRPCSDGTLPGLVAEFGPPAGEPDATETGQMQRSAAPALAGAALFM